MSTNEELIAAAKEHLSHNVWDDEIFVLADQLVTALEKVTAERDATVFDRVTRVTVVTDQGREFEKYAAYETGAEVLIQDDGRTLKVIPRQGVSDD